MLLAAPVLPYEFAGRGVTDEEAMLLLYSLCSSPQQ